MNEIVFNNVSMPVLTGCDLMAASEPFFHADRVLEFHVLIYVTEGAIYVTEEEMDYAIGPGKLLFLKKGLHHYGKVEIPRGTKWHYVHFYFDETEDVKPFEADSSPISPYTAIRTSRILPKTMSGLIGSEIEEKIRGFTDYFHSADGMRRWEINVRLWELLSAIAGYEVEKQETQSLSDRICKYLKVHLSEKFSADALEKEFYLSYKHLAFVFRKEKGMTMQQYHNMLRMNEAERLLKSTLLRIEEIADLLGFTDMLYFSRCFHNYTGMSPTRYRKDSAAMY